MRIAPEVFVSTLIGECYVRRNTIFSVFALVSLTLLTVGYFWPKEYVAFTIVHVDEQNILQSLMRGTAETTQPNDHASNAREIIYGEKIMDAVIKDARLATEDSTKLELEKLKEEIKKHTVIRGIGDNLIRIQYEDNEPNRTYTAVKRMTELFIEEGEKSKNEESQNAYEFINKQVDEYLVKLTKVEEELRNFHSNNLDARPGLEAEISQRISTIQSNIEQAKLQLREALIKKESIKEQLAGEAAITISQSKEGQYRSKIINLQDELERLRLDYKETYPDIVRIKHQIEDLKEAMSMEVRKREEAKVSARKTGQPYIDEAIVLNPLYQELRSSAASTDTEIATLRARINEMNKMLEKVYERARKIFGGEATLARLTRDYQVNQEIYQDLLRRRENARVSKNLDEEQKGLTISIQEPAKVPIIPNGLRFIHFALMGVFLGVAIPIGLVYLVLIYDPRVRFSEIVSSELSIPVFAEIPKITTEQERVSERRNIMLLGVGLLLIIIIYMFVGWMKLTGTF
jgi:polysaccharide chain length determinant protein (PEP-CTERM system associated)